MGFQKTARGRTVTREEEDKEWIAGRESIFVEEDPLSKPEMMPKLAIQWQSTKGGAANDSQLGSLSGDDLLRKNG